MPERKLLWAVLERAARDAAGEGAVWRDGDKTTEARESAIAWAESSDRRFGQTHFGFIGLCGELGLDQDITREAIVSGEAGRRLRDTEFWTRVVKRQRDRVASLSWWHRIRGEGRRVAAAG